jgi:hypothetical protein
MNGDAEAPDKVKNGLERKRSSLIEKDAHAGLVRPR